MRKLTIIALAVCLLLAGPVAATFVKNPVNVTALWNSSPSTGNPLYSVQYNDYFGGVAWTNGQKMITQVATTCSPGGYYQLFASNSSTWDSTAVAISTESGYATIKPSSNQNLTEAYTSSPSPRTYVLGRLRNCAGTGDNVTLWSLTVSYVAPPSPTADFTCTPLLQYTSGAAVQYSCTDASTGAKPTAWIWNITSAISGNSQYSMAQNFAPYLSENGTYHVALTAINSTYSTSNTTRKNNYLTLITNTSSLIRTYFKTKNWQDNSVIMGSNIQLQDNTTRAWVNTTNDADGMSYIDTYSTSTINAYATATGYQNFGQTGYLPFDGVYDLNMNFNASMADPGPGNVNLVVHVTDYNTGAILESASVSATNPSGATQGMNTGTVGSVMFVVPNMSVINIGVSKSGYQSASKTINTSAFGPDTLSIAVHPLTATPTGTIVQPTVTDANGNVITVAPTLDTRTNAQKDQGMMDSIREYGPNIIMLCVLVVIFSLAKMLLKW